MLEDVAAAEWQLVQEPDRLRVLVAEAKTSFAPTAVTAALTAELVSMGAVVPPIDIEYVAAIPRGRTGKAPLIKSNL